MRLHHAPSPNARRVDIFLAEKGIEIDRVDVDIRGGENLTPEYRDKNPAGRVPCLELDDGSFLSESVAICRYIEGLNPEPNLFGNDPLESAHIEMWSRRSEINFNLQVAAAFRNITGFFKDRETCVPEWGTVAGERAVEALEMFDTQLGQSEYLAGDRFTVADITFGVGWAFAHMVKVVELPAPANIVRWYEAVSGRPSFAG